MQFEIELASKFTTAKDPILDHQVYMGTLCERIIAAMTRGATIEETPYGLVRQYVIASSLLPLKRILATLSSQIKSWPSDSIDDFQTYLEHALRSEVLLKNSAENPLFWSYTTLVRLFHARKQYSPLLEKSRRHIPQRELQQIHEALLVGEQFLKNLSEISTNYLTLFTQFDKAIQQFKQYYQASFDAYKTNHLNEISALKKTADKIQRTKDLNALKQQSIEPLLIIFNKEEVVSANTKYIHDPTAYEGYTFAIADKTAMEQQKQDFLSQCEAVIYPELDFNGPILPTSPALVSEIHKALPSAIREAVELNLDQIAYRYHINDKNEFQLVAYFGKSRFWQTTLTFQSHIHTDEEEIWWFFVGGAQYKVSAIGDSPDVFLSYVKKHSPKAALTSIISNPINHIPTDELENLRREVERLIATKKDEIAKQYNVEIRHVIQQKTDQKLCQAMSHYFDCLQSINAALSLCWVNENMEGHNNLTRLLQIDDLPSSTKKWVSYLDDYISESSIGMELFDKANTFINHCKRIIPHSLEQARIYYHAMVSNVMQEGAQFINEYKATTKANMAKSRKESPLLDTQSAPEYFTYHPPSPKLAIELPLSSEPPVPIEEVMLAEEPTKSEEAQNDARIKKSLSELSLAIVSHFANVDESGQVKDIARGIDLLNQYVTASHRQPAKQVLQRVLEPLTIFRNNSGNRKIQEIIDYISTSIRMASDNRNNNIDTELGIIIKKTNKCAAVADLATAASNNQILEWSISQGSTYWANFHVNSLCMVASQHLSVSAAEQICVGNPFLWVGTISALIDYYRKRFSDTQIHSITMKEMRIVQESLFEGRQIEAQLKRFRDPRLYTSLLEQLASSYASFKKTYEEGLNSFEKQHLAEAKTRAVEAKKIQDETDIAALKAQIIPSQLVIFDGEKVLPSHGTICDPSQINQYTFARMPSAFIENQKTICVNHRIAIIYPEPLFDGPLLPLLPEIYDKLLETLPPVILNAVALNLGKLSFRYSLSKESFYFTAYFEDKACFKTTLDYKSPICSGHEAIWTYWAGNCDFLYVAVNPKAANVFDDYVKNNKSKGASFYITNNMSKTEQEQVAAYAQQLIKSYDLWIKKSYYTQVKQAVKENPTSPMTENLIEFFATIKCINAFLALAYDLPFSDKVQPTNSLEEILNILFVSDHMEKILAKYQRQMPQILEQNQEKQNVLFENALTLCTDFIDDYAPWVKINPLEELIHLSDGLIETWTEDSIEGFEHEPDMAKLHARFVKTKDAALATTIKDTKAKLYAHRIELEKFVTNPYSILNPNGFSVDLSIQNHRTLAQVKILSEQCLKVAMQVAKSAGFRTTSTISLGSALLEAVAAISDVFSQYNAPLIPMTVGLLTELTSQHKRILAEIALRQINLEEEIGLAGLQIITDFAHLDITSSMQAPFVAIYQRIVAHGLLRPCLLHRITESLNELRQTLEEKSITSVLDSISTLTHQIVYDAPHTPFDRHTLGHLRSQLLTAILETTKRAEVTGGLVLPDTIDPLLWAHLHINELHIITAPFKPYAINNPLLWASASLALLVLLQRQYPLSENREAYRITTTELNLVKTALVEGQKIQIALNGLRERPVYLSLSENLTSSLQEFKQAYEELVNNIKVKQAAELKQRHKDIYQEQLKRSTHQFETQNLEPSYLIAGGKKVQIGQPWCGDETFADSNASAATILSQLSYILYPENGFDGPLLPFTPKALINIHASLPKAVLKATDLNLGELQYRYCIEAENIFILTVYFCERACLKIKLRPREANTKLDTSPQAIWWYWAGNNDHKDFVIGARTQSEMCRDYYDNYLVTGFLRTLENVINLCNSNCVPRTDYKNAMRLAEEMLSENTKQLKNTCNLLLKQALETETRTTFGQATTAYFNAFHRMQTYLALCLEETGIVFCSRLQVAKLPTSREEMVAYLAKNPGTNGLELLGHMEAYCNLIDQYLQHMPTLKNSFMANVLRELTRFIDDYTPTQVPFNTSIPYTESDVPEDILQQERAHTAELVNLLLSLKESFFSLKLAPHQPSFQATNDNTQLLIAKK